MLSYIMEQNIKHTILQYYMCYYVSSGFMNIYIYIELYRYYIIYIYKHLHMYKYVHI